MTASNHTIFAVKRYAIHDGPNIRTTIFLKGCPLSCWWCHNPEGMSPQIELLADASKCIGCKECVEGCENNALSFIDKKIQKNEQNCTRCYGCLEICPTMVYSTTGWITSVNEVMSEIKKDLPFYDQSGGGVTFSGGEPLSQPDFLLELLTECGKIGIHRSVDTSCYTKTSVLDKMAQQTDLFLIDLKHMEESAHKTCTGVSNKPIHDNIRHLAKIGAQIAVRIPLIPGINDSEKNISESAKFIQSLPVKPRVDILEYHATAAAKYKKMNKNYPGAQIPDSDPQLTARAISILDSYGIVAQIGG